MGHRLNIAILIDQLVSGGVQKTAIREAKELSKLGYRVTLFVLVRLAYDYQYEDLTHDLSVIYLSDLNPPFFRRAIKVPFFSFLTHLHFLNPYFVGRYHIFKRYDFLVSHGTTTCITAAAITRKYKLPYLAFIWDPLVYILEKVYGQHFFIKYLVPLIKPVARRYEQNLLLSASCVATHQVHQKFIKDNYGVESTVVPPGCDPPRRTHVQHGRSVLGYTRWQLAKNPQFFLSLAKKLPRITFIIAGNWPDKTERQLFQTEIERLGLNKQIKLLTTLRETDVPKLAERSFVWVHPHFEAFGMAGLEMAALGLPLIIPKGSGVTELFTHTKEGYFPPSFDIQTVSKYLNFLHSHPETARHMGLEASKTARKYSWKHHARLLEQEILQYLSQTKIVTTINAFITPFATGGGDRFFIELASRTPKTVFLTIILPHVGLPHFQRAYITKPNIRYILLPPNPFDQHEEALAIFLAYLIRSWQTMFLLERLPAFKVFHTATDLIPDTFPAFIYRFIHPQTVWVARFFHFYAPPWQRQGSFLRNTGSYLLQRLSLLLFGKADLVLVDNPLLASDLAKHLGPKTNTQISTGGVEIVKILKTKPNPAFASTALFMGRLSAHKGVYDALDVWHQVNKLFPEARLTLLGYAPPWEMKKIKAKVSELHLSKNVSFPGFIHDRKAIYRYLRSSKLFLFLDHEAGFGLVVAEAMAAGLPVIAYDLPLFGSVFKQGFVTAPLKKVPAVAENIVHLLSNADLYQTISIRAHKQAKEFSWNRVSRKFYRLITTA